MLSTRLRSYALVMAIIGLVVMAMQSHQQPRLGHRNRPAVMQPCRFRNLPGEGYMDEPMSPVVDQGGQVSGGRGAEEDAGDSDDEEGDDVVVRSQHSVPHWRQRQTTVVASPNLQLLEQQRLPRTGRNRLKRVVGVSGSQARLYRNRATDVSSFANLH